MAREIARLIDGKLINPEQYMVNNNAVTPRRDSDSSQLVEYKSSEMPDLVGAMDHLREAISGMSPDDVSVSFTTEQTGDKKRSSFQFRACRR
jgi:hypothetical protein